MLFREFLYNHAAAVSMTLPSDIIHGKIVGVSYKTNPIKIEVQKDNGKVVSASFSNRFVYDRSVKNQKPEIGKMIEIHLGHKGNIKFIKVT